MQNACVHMAWKIYFHWSYTVSFFAVGAPALQEEKEAGHKWYVFPDAVFWMVEIAIGEACVCLLKFVS